MSNLATIPRGVLYDPDFTGPHSAGTNTSPDIFPSPSPAWCLAYQELLRLAHFGSGATLGGIAYCHTAASSLELMEALPIERHERPSDALTLLQVIERVFGGSASDLAKMLRVSRQMIYHYRSGMEPALENFRRIKLISSLADEVSSGAHVSFKAILKLPQPEGNTLLGHLSEKNPDIPTLRRILLRNAEDVERRRKVTATLAYTTTHDRQDIMRARHADGKPIYVTDPDVPGKIVQIRPDHTRVRGRMMNRVFVPDEE